MTDRIRLDDMTDAQLDALYARIATLEHVAASNKRHVQAIVPGLERAEAAIARVRALAEEYPAGIDTALIHAALDVPEPAGADTTPAEPVTVTDPAWLRQQYAAAMRMHYLCTDRNEADADGNLPCRCGDWREPGAEVDDENDWDSHLADAVMRVRDRHLQQLRQRLELAEHFHQDIASVQQNADQLGEDLDSAAETIATRTVEINRLTEERAEWEATAYRHAKLWRTEQQRADQLAATFYRIRRTIHIADAEDATDWQRGYRACVNRVTAELDSREYL